MTYWIMKNYILSLLIMACIRGVMQSWFESYLSNRKQYVSIKNCNSSMSNITLGVLQGSVLGPVLFFCISMTCIDPQIRRVFKILLTIQLFFHPTVILTMFMPLWISNMLWVDNLVKASRLFLNVSKTSYMIISNQKNALDIKIRD